MIEETLALLEYEIADRLREVDEHFSGQERDDIRQALLDEAAYRRELIRQRSADA